MTKKEQKEVAEQINCLKWRVALRWTDEVKPNVPPPSSSGYVYPEPLTKGFLPIYDHVEPACSSCINHGLGQDDKTSSQGPRSLFSTRLLALRALRTEMERRFAVELLRVDEQIETETKGRQVGK